MDNLIVASALSMTGLGIFFASVLAIADKKLKVEDDPRVDKINHILPGVNCGACGYLSCHDFADHIVSEGADPDKCRVVDDETREQLHEVAGTEAGAVSTQIPLVHCAAETEHKEPLAEYKGIMTCLAANLDFGGSMACQYGCMGLGDCTIVCPFDALHMDKGLPRLDIEQCTGCGKCVEACPRGVIKLQKKKHDKLFYVACSTHDGVLRVRQICKTGCIACGICEKLSKEGFFKVEKNLSYADYTKQDRPEEIEKLQAKCPTKVIKDL